MSGTRLQKQHGFTIVELLIVIVVIGILAAITIVAFNGVQQRAQTNRTVSAFSSWVKILRLYKADTGGWPTGWTCLGEGYLYGESGTDTTGTAQCRFTTGTGYVMQTSFNNKIAPYVTGTLPTPTFTTAVNSATDWRRGLFYAYGGGSGTDVYIDAVYPGVQSACPTIDGVTGNRAIWGGNTKCNYLIGQTTDS